MIEKNTTVKKIMFITVITVISVISIILIGCIFVYFNPMSKKKNHDFKVVIVLTDTNRILNDKGNKGAIERTIKSISNQTMQVDDISYCKSRGGKECCQSININRYNDNYGVGVVNCTFDREREKDTLVIFVPIGLSMKRNLVERLVRTWTHSKPSVIDNCTAMKSHQIK